MAEEDSGELDTLISLLLWEAQRVGARGTRGRMQEGRQRATALRSGTC